MGGTEISAERLLTVKNLKVYGNENKSQIHLHCMWMCVFVPVYVLSWIPYKNVFDSADI